ncbi:VCBS repeat-containing protein [candidate division KSB1 bacterium]|nr:VCBS repeat-containing protein [candidate division KSB1 bacterium]
MKYLYRALFFCLAVNVVSKIYAQDLPYFIVVDKESVGLTLAPFEKGGIAIHDIDRNGYPDIFCLRWADPGYSRIYINDAGYFQDITDMSPLQSIESTEKGTRTSLWADYDNDGDRDFSLATTEGIHLLRNDNNVFTEVSVEMGFVAPKPPGWIVDWDCNIGGWADYDLDGDLDCVVSQLSNVNLYLFRNDGDHFTNAATEAGLDSCIIAKEWRLVFTDFDLDGDPDLVGREHMFRNDNGYFTDATEELGFGNIDNVWYKRFFDYDNDGDLDFFKATRSVNNGEGYDELWENRDGVFYNISEDVGLRVQYHHRGMTFGDFDNDGDQDIFLHNGEQNALDVFFLNEEFEDGSRYFENVAEFAGLTETINRKNCACLDYDRNGFLDIYIPSPEADHILYQNLGDNGANWVGFILEGTVSNRDAVGSIVTLYTGEKRQIRLTRCGDQHFNQYNPWVHFGIGFETSIDSVVIRWPLGLKQVLTDVAINQYHDVKEGEVSAVKTHDNGMAASDAFQLEQNYPNPFNPGTKITYHLPYACEVRLSVFNIIGREVAVLASQNQQAGIHSVNWKAIDETGAVLPSGLYFYKLQAGSFVQVHKMMLVQ